MLTTTASAKPCRACPKTFVPVRPMQQVCGLTCAKRLLALGRKRAKEELAALKAALRADKQKTRARLDELRPLSYWTKQAQTAFNAWIRFRDLLLPCISCDDRLTGSQKFMAGQYDAGHYLTTGSSPELRFDEANVHKQCKQCNQHLHGNPARFRIGLIRRIGQAEVDRLEGPHEPKRYRADDLKALRDEYRRRLKTEMEKQ